MCIKESTTVSEDGLSNKLREGLRKCLTWKWKQYALEGKKGINLRLHYINLSGDYSYTDLRAKLGNLKINDNPPEGRRPNYNKSAYIKMEGGYLTIFFNPKVAYLPNCIIETSATSKKFLIKIAHLLPRLHVSMLEYAVDIFCANPNAVKSLFMTLRRYAYFPYQKQTKMYGQNPNDTMVDSSVMRAGPNKCYERGPNYKKRKGGGWHFKDLDRVRLEVSAENCYKAETGNYYLRKNCIWVLEDLITDPKFRKIFPGKIKFRKFPDSSIKLPREWDDYKIQDESGISDCFHEEYLHAKENCDLENVRQCMEPLEEFKELEDKILYMARQFDEDWKKDS